MKAREKTKGGGPPSYLLLLVPLLLGAASAQQSLQEASSPDDDTVRLACPEGWSKEGAKCLRILPSPASWSRSEELCRSRGGYLTRIESPRENERVGEMLSSSDPVMAPGRFWIGLKAEGESDFSWSNGVAVSQYIGAWAVGQPEEAHGNCVALEVSTGRLPEWLRTNCQRLAPAVCERPACIEGSFFCRAGGCIPAGDKCNGHGDCGDGSDEEDCKDTPCRSHQSGKSGKFASPFYPSQYGPAENCQWVLEAPFGHRIELVFDHFDTEPVADVVTISDGFPGSTNGSITVGKVTGRPSMDALKFASTTNILTVAFRSDRAIHASGFTASWKAVPFHCGGALSAQAFGQLLSSPSHPGLSPPGIECAWLLSSHPGSLLTLSVEELDLGDSELVLWDGDGPTARVLASFGSSLGPRTLESAISSGLEHVISTSNRFYVYFRGGRSKPTKGFSFNYKKGCDIVIRRPYGALLSPGITAKIPYPAGADCSYTIELPDASPDHALSLHVDHFDLGTNDYLQIFEGSAKGSPLHDGEGFTQTSRPPQQMLCRQSRAFIAFRASGIRRDAHSGFNISFSTNCAALDKPSSVSLSTRSTAYGTKVSISCPKGFEFVNGRGTSFSTACERGGRWSDATVPECQPVYCSSVPQIANGFAVAATNTTFGGVAKYACYEGFAFASGKKSEEIRCGEEGTWSALPVCKASSCPPLSPFMHGDRTLAFGDGSGYGSVYRFECAPGFRRNGAAALLCQNDGRWSFEQPSCTRLECPSIPKQPNGRLLVQRPFLFDQTAKVICNDGFAPDAQDEVRCLANQTLSPVASCVDVDECAGGIAKCDVASTACVNRAGGYECECLTGYDSLLSCDTPGVLHPTRISVSSRAVGAAVSSTSSWCASPDDDERVLRLHFAVPHLIEQLHFEREHGGFPTEVAISYTSIAGMPLKELSEGNKTVFAIKNAVAASGSFLTLPTAIEAVVVEIEVVSYTGEPCMKVEALGCQRTACADRNECIENNGGCEQICMNALGGHKCACKDGYDLFTEDGQGGTRIKDGESGRKEGDVYRLQASCIPRVCPPLSAPEHGSILSTAASYAFPVVVRFQCEFGHQMAGPEALRCTEEGTWNGTAPTCIPATCRGVRNNTEIGLFVTPEGGEIPFGQSVTVHCTQQSRPAKKSPLAATRDCVYDPRPGSPAYWLSGPPIDCPLVECGPPPVLAGVVYDGDVHNRQVGALLTFACRPPYGLVGRSSYDDHSIRCTMDGSWDLGDLRCEGPVCVDPGFPNDGAVELSSVEEGAVAKFTCARPGFRPFPTDSISCQLGQPCLLSEDIGISSGYVHDGAFADNSDAPNWGYEPHKARMTSTGWCGHKDAFIFLSVDLQRIHTITTLRIAGVAGSGALRGHVTKLQLFHKIQFSHNYDTYPVEFETPAGNHNALHQFELDPPLKARFILLGVSEYEENPCMRFDLQGCLAPSNPAAENNLQVGWNSSLPQCVDAEPPSFLDCPEEPVLVASDEAGQLLPTDYTIPRAVDNSGRVAWVRVEPAHFAPPQRIVGDQDVVYTAFDDAGNSAECVVKLRVPDTQPPILRCPDSYEVHADKAGDAVQLVFNSSTVSVHIQDVSNITAVIFSPAHAALREGEAVTVQVTAIDARNNKADCKFQVAHLPKPCSDSSLSLSNTTIRTCAKKDGGKVECVIACKEGHRFVDETQVETTFTCHNGHWQPSAVAPSCVPLAEEPARYELRVRIDYPVDKEVGRPCLQAYTDAVASHFDSLDGILSTRCSSSVQVFVRVLDVKFAFEHDKVAATYTIQILPTVLQNVFYDLCSLTLRTIFDLRIPGATTPVKELLSIPSSVLSKAGASCPSLQAIKSDIGQGFGCSPGDVLRQSTGGEGLPECLPCAAGSVNVNNTCMRCPLGSYQDLAGQVACKGCPDATWTQFEGSTDVKACMATCGNGMYSHSGLVPCLACPRHTFSGPPSEGGVKRCENCPSGGYTAQVGASGPSQCKQPCAAGTYSTTGLQPCSACPLHTYQANIGQQRCHECAETEFTPTNGTVAKDACKPIDCKHVQCRNRGTCVIRKHEAACECPPGYSGRQCENTEPFCDAAPCVNGGMCELVSGTFRCRCPPNYSGRFCQHGPDECRGVRCPNGGVCHDLPGIGTTKCICRTGFAGQHCAEINDACSAERSPCHNGAECVAQALGRFKCKCAAGWSGLTCAENIDDCADSPCAMNATCHDLVHDFRCECPKGFSGKRCHVKEELCTADACLHGMCVDRLTEKECLCEPGWTGSSCDVNIDECADKPCKNGGTCRDLVNGFTCDCAPGYAGSACQHLVDHCASGPCSNNGTCTNLGASFACECPLGFEGTTCDENVDECTAAQCNKQGTEKCVDGIDTYECACKPGWEGRLCDAKIDQCAGIPCLNDGTCVDTGSAYLCECPVGWTGRRCEVETGACAAKPCKNDAICLNLANDYLCVCPEGVSGRNCERAPDRCIGSPCKHGGVCTDLGSRLECTCPAGRTGLGCQFVAEGCNSGSCLNGGECRTDAGRSACKCAPGFTGATCETNVDECATTLCPKGSSCVDQINAAVCVCPMNATGVNCDKAIDIDYDLVLAPGSGPTRAARKVPTPSTKAVTELSLALWVKFDEGSESGTVATLYNSSSSNYSSDLHQLVSISGEGVVITITPDATPVKMAWPTPQPINDGRWHHVVVTWSSTSGGVSVVWNSVRIFSEAGHAKGAAFNASFAIVLGSSMEASSRSFAGRLTRLALWERALDFEAEIPGLVGSCQGADEIFPGLLVRFAGYDDVTGRVDRVATSTCGRMAEDAGGRIGRMAGDAGSLVVEFCPEDMTISTSKKVTWQEPRFVVAGLRPSASASTHSTQPPHVVGIRQNLRSGATLTPGLHEVLYIATDSLGRSAHCAFKVHVARSACPRLANPLYGTANCESWGPALRYKACSIRCLDGYAFSIAPASFYTCGADGRWRPDAASATPHAHFAYPQCTRHVPATRLVSLSLDYPAVSPCTSAGRDALADNVAARIAALNDKWTFCNLKDATGCVGARVSVECESVASVAMRVRAKRGPEEDPFHDDHDLTEIYREKRDIFRLKREEKPPQQLFRLKVELPVKREKLFDSRTGRSLSVVDILEEAILGESKALSLEKILPNGRPDLHSLRVEDVFSCQTGSVVVEDLCVPCSPGTFFDSASATCVPCPIGHHQQQPGRTQCNACPSGFTTVSTGAVDERECKVSCAAGQFLDLSDPSSNACSTCGFAFYQPSTGSFDCLACPAGQTTLTTTATSAEECRDECPDGEELSATDGCTPCPRGWYRGRGSQARCLQCPSGTTTHSDRSARREQCDTPRCTKGQFLVPESKQCQLCPRGAYQDGEEQTACKLCPPDHTTAAQGATAEKQCYSTNQCATGEDNCSWHALCIDLPDDLEQPRFECRCKPGYRGNGTHCYDACQNLCLNDGVCKKNPIGYVECVCKEGFSGERCEHRFQPKGQKVAMITIAVGAVVAILIVIVIVIAMISFRTNRVIDSAEKGAGLGAPLGLPGASPLGMGCGDSTFGGPGGNFFVGPRGLDAPRPIGYYYEDDDEYDMKTMYIGDGGGFIDSGNASRGERSGGSSASSNAGIPINPEIERRRRIAAQHMYRPAVQRAIESNNHGQGEYASPPSLNRRQSTNDGEQQRSSM